MAEWKHCRVAGRVVGMANALIAAVNRGLDVTWLDDLPVKVNAVTNEQVNAAIKKYLKPENMVTVRAGSFAGAAVGAAAK